MRSRSLAARSASPRIAYAVGRLDRALRRRIAHSTAEAGLTVAQYTALSVLAARGTLSNAALAQRSLVSPQAMNEIIQLLARKGVVERRDDPAHGRIVQIALTAPGRALLARCDRAVRRLERELLAPFSPSERVQLGRMLRECIERLEAGPAGAGD